MTTKGTIHIRKPFLSGISQGLTFTIGRSGAGFKPDTLTMSVYDRNASVSPATNTIVNERNDVDMLAFCSDDGVVLVTLDPADTTVVPLTTTRRPPSTYKRHVLFAYTYGSPPATGKFLFTLTIAPDYEGSAT